MPGTRLQKNLPEKEKKIHINVSDVSMTSSKSMVKHDNVKISLLKLPDMQNKMKQKA